MTLAIALGVLTARVIQTVPCLACGHPVQVEHDPVEHAYPKPRLVEPPG